MKLAGKGKRTLTNLSYLFISVCINQSMLATLKKYEEEDNRVHLKKCEEIKKMRKEVLIANENAIFARRAVKEREKEVRC